MALFTGDGEFEAIDPGEPLVALGIACKGEAAQSHVAIQQFELEAGAVLFDAFQRFLAQTMGVPPPGRSACEQHQHENVSQGQHDGVLQQRSHQLNCPE